MKNKHVLKNLVDLYVYKILNEGFQIEDVPQFLLDEVKKELEARKED